MNEALTDIEQRDRVDQPLLCLAMIVKDGGQLFAELLTEARPWVDEIIIGDTGSKDDSRTVGEDHGALVLPLPWNDDFSLARNTVLDSCQARWILFLDADEKICPEDWKILRSWVTEHTHQKNPPAVRLNIRDYQTGASSDHRWQLGRTTDVHQLPGGHPAPGYFPYQQIRLFPNGRNIHFRGCLHERVSSSLMDAGLTVVDHPVRIHHLGLLQNNPGRDELLLKLARIVTTRDPHSPVAWSTLAGHALQAGKNEEALSALDRALILDPGNIKLRLMAGKILKTSGMLEQANLQLNAVAGAANITDEQLADSCHLRAEVALLRNQHERVAHLLGVAIRLCPDNGHYYRTLARWHQKENRADAAHTALKKMHKLWGEEEPQVQPVLVPDNLPD